MTLRRKPVLRCCQHARYGFMLVNGVRHAQCAECGHTWMIFVGDGDTDYLPAEMPGIALR